MTTRVKPGPRDWSCTRDAEGHREYKITSLVISTDSRDGPATVLQTPGLYLPGATWSVDNDLDVWAWCYPNAEVTPLVTKEKNKHWEVTQTFGTKGPAGGEGRRQRCNDNNIEDPLLEPQKVSGSFTNKSVEAYYDRFGNPIRSSSHEQFRGAVVEFDEHSATVRIEQNVIALGLSTFSAMVNTVNSTPMWGMQRRQIKLSNVTWERKYFGQCFAYYTRVFEFEISGRGFDRDILDEGDKALYGNWGRAADGVDYWVLKNLPGTNTAPDPSNPAHFKRVTDREGNLMRVVLDGHGKPAFAASQTFRAVSVSPVENLGNPLGSGSNYCVGDILGLDGGTFTSRVMVIVTKIHNPTIVTLEGGVHYTYQSINGPILEVKIRNPGSYSVVDANPKAVDDASSSTIDGTGAQFNVTWGRVLSGVSNAGRIHVEKYGESYFPLLGIPLTF